ncbi:hypothetical protein [Frankia sp. CiP3]|uniref:hypothetical protein n=1 Tax=Frankia sp. CiP3 TaxID=2880971 RepID=UPI001EF4066D|nr:hypothetical protein [Frankia sp. CiP3]
MNQRDLRVGIAQQLKSINDDAGAFVAGLLSDDIPQDEQITFALRLVRLAEHSLRQPRRRAYVNHRTSLCAVQRGSFPTEPGSSRPDPSKPTLTRTI